MLIKQIYQNNVIFVTIGILKILVLNMSLVFATVVMILMQKAMSFNNVAIVCSGKCLQNSFLVYE